MLSSVLRRFCAGLLLAGAVACTGGTAPGTPLISVEFTEAQGGPPPTVTGTVSTSQHTVRLNPDGEATVDLSLEVLKTTQGTFLKKAILHAGESAGGLVSASVSQGASPTNVGSHDEFIAMLPMHVLWTKDYYVKMRSGVTLIHLRADETVQID